MALAQGMYLQKSIQVSDFPRTRSGKISELAVRNIIHNKKLKNIEALMNPEVLDIYSKILKE